MPSRHDREGILYDLDGFKMIVKKYRIHLLFYVVVLLLSLQIGITRPAPPAAEDDGFLSVWHGGGAVDGFALTNSLEALEQSAEKGRRYVELDISWTADEELVCLHDWGAKYSAEITEGIPLFRDTFMKLLIYDRFRPLDMPALIAWLKAHPEMTIITDIKEKNVAALVRISQDYPDMMDRFIPQIYAYSEYGAVSSLGFDRIILTLYQMSWNDKMNTAAIASFAQEYQLWGIAFAKEIATGDYVSALKASGVRLFVHTVNSEDKIAKYREMGCSGVYRDWEKTEQGM